jgi:lipopolysaccharide biosynthesis glycosyltransferase
MIPVFIGYDEVETGAFWTCASSIVRNSSQPVAIIPIRRSQLPLTRCRHPKQSNEFAFTRFLVPHLQNYSGCGIFVDCDFLFLGDISDLWFLRDPTKAVQVVKHDASTFKEGKKYLGTEQTVYPRKCWTSLMLFNSDHPDCQKLTPSFIDSAEGLYLHQLQWAKDENIGSLPPAWNYLVEHSPSMDRKPKAIHYTEGGPYFEAYKDTEYAAEWWDAYYDMKYVMEGLT